MKLIFKNFIYLIRRFKSSAILNVMGLSVAFAVFITVAIQLYYDATYNRCFEKADNIALVSFYLPKDDIDDEAISMPYAKRLADNIPEIKNYTLTDWSTSRNVKFDLAAEGTSSSLSIKLSRVREGFIDMFNPKVIKGNANDILTGDDKAMINESLAKKLFGNEDPIGKIIYYHDTKNPLEIVALFKDFPENCSFSSEMYINLPFFDRATTWNYVMYIELQPGSLSDVAQKLNSDELFYSEDIAYYHEHPDEREILKLIPIKDIYMLQGSNKATFMSLLFIGIIVLCIAYINYFNFAVAMAPSRVRAINIHKILGIHRLKLRTTILLEGVFFALIAIILALLIIHTFASSALSGFFAADFSISDNLPMIGILIALFILLIVIVAIYPARYASSFPEAVALNSSFTLSPKGIKIRNILITIQFTAAVSISCIALYIKIQHSYMQNYSTGIQRENIVYLPNKGLNTDLYTLGEEMSRNPNILDYTASLDIPGNITTEWGRKFEEKQVSFTMWPVIPGFLNFFGIKVIAGNDFSPTKSDTILLDQVIVNNKFLEKYEFDNTIIGKEFSTLSKGILNGVAGDVNFQSLHIPIGPMVFIAMNNREDLLKYTFFKVSGKDLGQTIDYMQQTWSKFSSEEFDLRFLDHEMDNLYKREGDMAKLISIFGLIIIIIAVMGVYGLIIFNTRYKEREIAIRKVNGSTVSEIMVMLNKELLLLLPIAIIISTVIAWFAIDKWGEQFPYKAVVSWWLFAAAGVLAALITIATVSWQSWRAATANPTNILNRE